MKTKIILISFLAICHVCLAQVNQIDTTFGNKGVVFNILDTASVVSEAAVLQTDGKIVVIAHRRDSAGSKVYTSRFHSDGNVDPTFGSNGTLTLTQGMNKYAIYTIIQLSSGKLLLGGNVFVSAGYKPLILRLNTNGSLDNTFGNGGSVVLDSIDSRITVLEEITNGAILAYGNKRFVDPNINNSSHPIATLTKLNSNGSLDTTFQSSGSTWLPMYGISSILNTSNTDRIVLGSSEFIFYQGNGSGPPSYYGNPELSLLKVDNNGAVDSTFRQGISLGNFNISPTNIAQHGGGHFLCTGFSSANGQFSSLPLLRDQFRIARFNMNGEIDTTFGIITTSLDSNAMATDIKVLPDLSFLVVGISFDALSNQHKFTVVRYNPDGTLDSSCVNPIFKHISGNPSSQTLYPEYTPSLLSSDPSTYILVGSKDSNSMSGIVMGKYFTDCDTINNIGLEEWNLAGVSVFPNPNSGSFSIEFEEIISGTLEIYTLNGQQVYRQKVEEKQELDLHLNLAKGVYVLKLEDKNQMITKRLIIQ